jgi:hypothetical protein
VKIEEITKEAALKGWELEDTFSFVTYTEFRLFFIGPAEEIP